MIDALAMMVGPDGLATSYLRGRWRAKGAAQALLPRMRLAEPDLSATREFRGLWAKAFPTRDPLPFGPIVTREGRFTDPMLEVWI